MNLIRLFAVAAFVFGSAAGNACSISHDAVAPKPGMVFDTLHCRWVPKAEQPGILKPADWPRQTHFRAFEALSIKDLGYDRLPYKIPERARR